MRHTCLKKRLETHSTPRIFSLKVHGFFPFPTDVPNNLFPCCLTNKTIQNLQSKKCKNHVWNILNLHIYIYLSKCSVWACKALTTEKCLRLCVHCLFSTATAERFTHEWCKGRLSINTFGLCLHIHTFLYVCMCFKQLIYK